MGTASPNMDHQALAGIKVADFTWAAAGPLAVRYLADHGAQVVKIETATQPDQLRRAPPFKDRQPGFDRAGYFSNVNRGKLSIRLNLNHPRGPEIAKRIVAWSDVVVENFTPGQMAKWGLSYEDLKKVKPEIIMLSSSQQGQTGPRARHPGLGVSLVAYAGFTHLTGWPDRTPTGPYGPYPDVLAPPLGAVAVLACLIRALRTGRGMYIDLSQLECALQFVASWLLDYTVNGRQGSRQGNRCDYAAPHGAYPCQGDDRWCAIAISSDEEWQRLRQAMGSPAWADDERFATLRGRKQHEDEIDALIAGWTRERSAEEVMNTLQQADVAAGAVLDGRDLHQDPQLRYRQHFQVLDHPEIGPHTCDAPPFTLSHTPAQLRRAPLLGENTERVCCDILGMTDQEFVQLMEQGVFD